MPLPPPRVPTISATRPLAALIFCENVSVVPLSNSVKEGVISPITFTSVSAKAWIAFMTLRNASILR